MKFSSCSPAANGKHGDHPCHEERREAHADGKGEHCIQAIGLHELYHFFSLNSVSIVQNILEFG